MNNEHSNAPTVPQGWTFSVSDDDDGTWLRVKSPGGREAAFSAVNGGLAHDNRRSIASRVLLELKEALATTPAPAPAVPSVQQGWVEQMLTDLRHVFDAGGGGRNASRNSGCDRIRRLLDCRLS